MKKLIFVLLVAMALPQTASALQPDEVLALVAMPLAVAAVAELGDVPMQPLIEVVSALNDADVPPVEFVEVVRYVPVALVEEGGGFVRFVQVRRDEGLRGTTLTNAIEQEFETTYLLGDLDLRTPSVHVIDAPFFPAPVVTRVRTAKAHPHGGPPGQLKKITGERDASRIAHDGETGRRVGVRVIDRDDKVKPGKPAKVDKDDKGKGKEVKADRGNGNAGGHGKGGNHGKGGKGKG